MIIAVASGKGGTGKTTIAVSLALVAAERGPTRLIDCDVEAPDDALFLEATFDQDRECGVPAPVIDADACTLCGRCAEVCAFNALAVLSDRVLTFPGLCHGCGSCTERCPEHAIREEMRVTGVLEAGHADRLGFARGTLRVGDAMATPVIRQLKEWQLAGTENRTVILDAPPGTACPVVETLRGVDYALLVTEPTPFGLHDLELAVRVARDTLGLPVGVIVNRDTGDDVEVERFCIREDIPLLLSIPLDRRVAVAYSDGVPLVEALPEYRARFEALLAEGVAA